MLEVSGLAVFSPTLGLYQVQVDGFAWLNQHDCLRNAGLHGMQLNRTTTELSFHELQPSDT